MSTIIGPVSSTTYPLQATTAGRPTAQPPAGPPPQGDDPVSVAAAALGMDVDALTAALDQGSSLADVAAAQGVDTDTLTQALTAAAPEELQGSSDLEQVVASMIAQAGGPRPPQDGAGTARTVATGAQVQATGALTGTLTGAQQDAVDGLGALLGTDGADVLAALADGTGLADLLQAAGVPASALADLAEPGMLFDATV